MMYSQTILTQSFILSRLPLLSMIAMRRIIYTKGERDILDNVRLAI